MILALSLPEVDYGRPRDDKYGKGLNTITKEKLEREEMLRRWIELLNANE